MGRRIAALQEQNRSGDERNDLLGLAHSRACAGRSGEERDETEDVPLDRLTTELRRVF